jgi:glycine cleavage system H protein
MSQIPEELKYTKTHEWVRRESDNTVTVGITDHAQNLLGDMVYVETPEVGTNFGEGDDCAVVESVKAATDVYCPIAGEIITVNESLADAPEIINKDPFGDGWLFKLRPVDVEHLEELLDAEAYAELAASEEH